MFCARFVIRTANINHQPAVVAPGNGGVKAAGCLHATTNAFSSVMRIMMIATLHFVQQPVLAGSSSLFWFADCDKDWQTLVVTIPLQRHCRAADSVQCAVYTQLLTEISAL